MNPNPGMIQGLRDDSALQRAAMLVIDELGESAADYAETRAIALQRQGDEMGASTWRRIAPVIEEMQRKKSASPKAQTDSTIGPAGGTELRDHIRRGRFTSSAHSTGRPSPAALSPIAIPARRSSDMADCEPPRSGPTQVA